MTETPVRRWTEVAIAGFKAAHSFEALSVTIEQTEAMVLEIAAGLRQGVRDRRGLLVSFINQAPEV
jgi:hypothetical protein